MNETNRAVPAAQGPGRFHRACAWIGRRSGAFLSSALRGAAYGCGAGVTGLLFWWLRQMI